MQHRQSITKTPADYLAKNQPDMPVFFFDPKVLRQAYHELAGQFTGQVTFAVKANPNSEVLENLVASGMTAFDVASIEEMKMVRNASARAQLHYHNPVRSRAEIAAAREFGITSWSIDSLNELNKIGPLSETDEIAVRLALPVKGAAYDFGAKFGAPAEKVITLLQEVARRGARPSVTFHPGTQCNDPKAWQLYITEIEEITRTSGISLFRLNIGGGLASNRAGIAPNHTAILETIHQTVASCFEVAPKLVCEPGRAMVAEAYQLALRVKAIRDDGSIFLNDGIYGTLGEMRDMPSPTRFYVLSSAGQEKSEATIPRDIWGPTCDSVDRLPNPLDLPTDLDEGDYILFQGAGAYSSALATPFNGYGAFETVTVGDFGI